MISSRVSSPLPGAAPPGQVPYDEVRDWVQSHRNHFDRLDRAAEELVDRLGSSRVSLREDLVRHAGGPPGDDAAMLLLRYRAHGSGGDTGFPR